MNIFSDKDACPQRLFHKKIVIFGYGSQGRAQALNARDSGVVHLKIALPESSHSRQQAELDGFDVLHPVEAAKEAELAMILTPDETHGALYRDVLAQNLPKNTAIGFSHGFGLHFGEIQLREDLTAFLVAPKGPGYVLRANYLKNSGLMARIAVWPASKDREELQLAIDWASLIGCGRIGMFVTDFAQETESNLFGEQAILCGGAAALLRSGFEVMVENGISPEMAYLESVHSLKIIADLIYEKGLEGASQLISRTAAYGGYVGEAAYLASDMKSVMMGLMNEIKSGKFAERFQQEKANAYPLMQKREMLAENEQISQTGRQLRNWLFKDNKIEEKGRFHD